MIGSNSGRVATMRIIGIASRTCDSQISITKGSTPASGSLKQAG